MAPTLDDLIADLRAETGLIIEQLDRIDYEQWALPTPATGWTLKDQIAHLAYFDEMAALSATDGDAFRTMITAAVKDGLGVVDRVANELRSKPASEVDAWFRTGREAMTTAFVRVPAGFRVPWYGPAMSASSSLTARIMETWAHGQDIADTLCVAHPSTSALRNVAHICARTFANSFRTNGLAVPEVDVRVELHSDADTWVWGNDTAESVVGDAVDFCLVATQRRHIDDTALVTTGAVARQWMEIAQAFAGPPGTGRAPANPPRHP